MNLDHLWKQHESPYGVIVSQPIIGLNLSKLSDY